MNLKLLLPIIFLLSLPVYTLAQHDSTVSHRKWYTPDGLTLQFAGNVGMFAAGPNYSFAKDKLNAELLYGFVPKLDADETLHLLTIRGIYKPVKRVELSEKYKLTPLRINLGLSYYFGEQLPTTWDSFYPEGYYWWSPALRLTGGLGAELHHPISNSRSIKELTLYGEIGTYDLIVTSAVKDPSLTAWDIMSFAIGVRAGF